MLPTDQLKGSDPISFKFFNLNWIREGRKNAIGP